MSLANFATEQAAKLRLEAAKRFAAADKSDPFCMARILCHMQQGVTKCKQEQGDVVECDYSAQEARDMDGNVVWTNRVRP